jgi:mannan endo-1,6-alpha-mannosidase
LTRKDSIKSVAKDLAGSIIAIYNNTPKGTPPGLFGGPYFFWSAGAVWGGLLDYAHYTGDTQYNQLVFDAIAFQIGQDDFAPTNQTKALVRISLHYSMFLTNNVGKR